MNLIILLAVFMKQKFLTSLIMDVLLNLKKALKAFTLSELDWTSKNIHPSKLKMDEKLKL